MKEKYRIFCKCGKFKGWSYNINEKRTCLMCRDHDKMVKIYEDMKKPKEKK